MPRRSATRRPLVGLAGPLLWVGALGAQQSSAPAACRDLPGGGGPVPQVTASMRGGFLKGGRILIEDAFLDGSDGSRIRAYVIKPFKPVAGGGAVLFLHWLGGPPANDRSEFFQDAMALAAHNVTSLLIDAPWADPAWFPERKLADDLVNTPKYITQLQGYLRYLMSTAKPDSGKVALVGHDFGGMYGALLMQREPTIRHAVVMAAVGDFGDWFVLGHKFTDLDSVRYRRDLVPLAPTRYLRCAGNAEVLFQFARTDPFVSASQAAALVESAPAAKSVLWYPGGHELQDASRKDRLAWLIKRIGTGTRP